MKASNTFLSRLIRISDNLAAATDEAWGFLGWRLFKTWHNMRQSVTRVGVDLGPFGPHTSCQINAFNLMYLTKDVAKTNNNHLL